MISKVSSPTIQGSDKTNPHSWGVNGREADSGYHNQILCVFWPRFFSSSYIMGTSWFHSFQKIPQDLLPSTSPTSFSHIFILEAIGERKKRWKIDGNACIDLKF